MIFTLTQQKEAYKKLSPEVQDFIMSNETTELIGGLLEESGLSEEQTISADSEILYAMFGLQTLDSAIINIASLSNKGTESFSNLKMNLEDKIFNMIDKMPKKKPEENQNTNSVGPVPRSESGVGESFEQIILNQAKAMQPAQAPTNLPIENNEKPKEEEPEPIHDYSTGSDPYREPIG